MEELRGQLAVGVLPEVLRRLAVTARSGVLQLAHVGDKSELEFSEGFLTSAETTLPGARLGDFLVQVGFIGDPERNACLEIAALSHQRLGDVLLRHRLLDAEHLAQGFVLQLREVLARALTWSSGVYRFVDASGASPEKRDHPPAPRVDAREVLLDATWTLMHNPVIDALLGDLDQKVRKSSDERIRDLGFRLSPNDAFLLTRVDGEMSATELLKMSPLPGDEAKTSLAGLLAVGLIEYADAAPPTSVTSEIVKSEVAALGARINSPDPYKILGVDANAPDTVVRAAYLKLLQSCVPAASADPEFRPILHRMSEQLADAFKEIQRRRRAQHPPPPNHPVGQPAGPAPSHVPGGAKQGPPVSRPASPQASPAVVPPVPARPPVDPSRALELAGQASDAGRSHEALAILDEAIPQLQGRARQAARVRKSRLLLAVHGSARQAEEELKLAIREDPGNVAAHLALGDIFREGGALALATMEYRKAIELEPRNGAAREALQQMATEGSPEPPKPASVLRRFFGR